MVVGPHLEGGVELRLFARHYLNHDLLLQLLVVEIRPLTSSICRREPRCSKELRCSQGPGRERDRDTLSHRTTWLRGLAVSFGY